MLELSGRVVGHPPDVTCAYCARIILVGEWVEIIATRASGLGAPNVFKLSVAHMAGYQHCIPRKE